MANTVNPYETLRISILASNEEIVASATKLLATEADEGRKAQYRAAVDALTTHPRDRVYHMFWEPAAAGYQDAAEEAFLARYGAGPVDREALNMRCGAFLDEDCAAGRLLDALMPAAQPPDDLHCDPARAPQAPLRVEVEPGDLFV